MANEREAHICAHPGCNCHAPKDEKYCSRIARPRRMKLPAVVVMSVANGCGQRAGRNGSKLDFI